MNSDEKWNHYKPIPYKTANFLKAFKYFEVIKNLVQAVSFKKIVDVVYT